MEFLTSKNGSKGAGKKTSTTTRTMSDIRFRSSWTTHKEGPKAGEPYMNSVFNFSGCWKKLNLAENGIAFGKDGRFVVFPNTDERCQVFGKIKEGGKAKTKNVKVNNFAKILGEKQLLTGDLTINQGEIGTQFLSINKVESPEGLEEFDTYEVVSAGIAPTVLPIEVRTKSTEGAINTAVED